MIAYLADGRRALLRALADQFVSALACVASPGGCRAASGSAGTRDRWL